MIPYIYHADYAISSAFNKLMVVFDSYCEFLGLTTVKN